MAQWALQGHSEWLWLCVIWGILRSLMHPHWRGKHFLHQLCKYWSLQAQPFRWMFLHVSWIFRGSTKFHMTLGCRLIAKSLQSCPTLCDPIDGSPPGSAIPGILQARTLEWVAISFSNAWKWKLKVKSLSRVRLLATSWTSAYQAPRPWNFPGKSTGVGCHCLLQCTGLVLIKSLFELTSWD